MQPFSFMIRLMHWLKWFKKPISDRHWAIDSCVLIGCFSFATGILHIGCMHDCQEIVTFQQICQQFYEWTVDNPWKTECRWTSTYCWLTARVTAGQEGEGSYILKCRVRRIGKQKEGEFMFRIWLNVCLHDFLVFVQNQQQSNLFLCFQI